MCLDFKHACLLTSSRGNRLNENDFLGIYLGCEGHGNYKVQILGSSRVNSTRNLHFDEHVFPLKKEYKTKELHLSRQERNATHDDQNGSDMIIEKVQDTNPDIVEEHEEDDHLYGKNNRTQQSISVSH